MIWFDLDNSPHVPLFAPVFQELEKRKISFDVTARDFAQTLELLKMHGIGHTAIGRHGGKSKINKILNLLERSRQLKKYIKNKPNGPEGIKLAVSHGSRTQLVAANKMKIRTLLMMDTLKQEYLTVMPITFWFPILSPPAGSVQRESA
jgi:uncharacterized protein